MAIREVFINCHTDFNVPINDIKQHPAYCIQYEETDVKALATSIVNVGFFVPIVVALIKDHIICVDGHLRIAALRYLREPHKMDGKYEVPEYIPVVISDRYDIKLLLELGHLKTNVEPLYKKYFPAQW